MSSNHVPIRSLVGSLALVLTACPSAMNTPDTGVDAHTTNDGAGMDSTITPDGTDSTATCTPVVTITSPSQATTYVRGSLTVQFTVQGCSVEELTLRVDGQMLAIIRSPFQYTWDTSLTAEGSHELVADAVVDGVTTQSETRTVVIDRTPPTIIQLTPAAADTNASVRAPIVAVFSEPVAAATVTPTTVMFNGASAGAIATTLQLSTDGRTLTATLNAAPAVPETVTATLTAGITDLAGNALVPDTSHPWTWTYPSWVALGAQVRLYPTSNFSRYPTLAIDADDTIRVSILDESLMPGPSISIERWDGSAWQHDGPARGRTGTTAPTTPTFARTRTGESVLSWSADDGTTRSIFTTRTTASGTDQDLDPPLSHVNLSTPAEEPSLALSGSGDPIVAWQESVASARSVYVAAWTGTAWSEFGAGLDVRGGATPSGHPVLALNSSGAPVVAFSEVDLATTSTDIFVSRWTGSAWEVVGGVPVTPTTGSTDAGWASLALTSAGEPTVSWIERPSSTMDGPVYVKRFDGTMWRQIGPAFNADPAASSFSHSTHLVLDATDTPYVALADGPAVYVYRFSGGMWARVGDPLVEPSLNPGQINSLSMRLDSHGTPVVAWEQQQASFGYRTVWVRRYNN